MLDVTRNPDAAALKTRTNCANLEHDRMQKNVGTQNIFVTIMPVSATLVLFVQLAVIFTATE